MSGAVSSKESRDAALYEEPWPHLIVDGFLPESSLTQGLAELGAENYQYDIEYRGTGRIEFSLLKSKILWREVYSKTTISLIKEAFNVEVSLNRQNLLQVRRMNNATPEFPIHHDYIEANETIASFLYLSPNWSQERGGRFNLFATKDQKSPSLSIDPIQNRFLAFRTAPTHWHSVERVVDWDRFSVLALWDIR